MSKQYLTISVLPENLYALGAPVMIVSGVLRQDSETEELAVQLVLRSLSDRQIRSVTVALQQQSDTGAFLGSPLRCRYSELSAERNDAFGQDIPILVNESQTRNVTASVEEVQFADGSRWRSQGEPWELLRPPMLLENVSDDEELVKQYQLTFGPQCTYMYWEEKDLWYCGCGTVNRSQEKICCRCGAAAEALKNLDWSALEREKEERLAAEQPDEEERLAAQRRKQEVLLAAEQRRKEERRAAEQRKREEDRLAAEQRKKEEERLAAEQRKEEEKRLAAEQQEREAHLETERRKEEARLAAQRRKEEERLAAALRKREEERLAAQQRRKEEAHQAAEERKKEEKRLAAERQKEDARLAAQQRKEEECLAAALRKREEERLAAQHRTSDAESPRKQKPGPGTAGKRLRTALILIAVLVICVILAVVLPKQNEQQNLQQRYDQALALLEEDQYDGAKAGFLALDGYKDSAQQAANVEAVRLEDAYMQACALRDSKEYIQAADMFKGLGDYKDAPAQARECQYLYALALLEQHNYETAVACFQELGAYRDAQEQCRNGQYLYALDLIKEKAYYKAARILRELGDYKDAADLLAVCRVNRLQVGGTVALGAYEQDNDLENGQEKIEWIIRKQEGDRVLLVSKYILDAKPRGAPTWELCSIRKWLNGPFLETAFTEDEQLAILSTTVQNPANAKWDIQEEADTVDQVFLLSAQEYYQLNKAGYSGKTAYAQAQQEENWKEFKEQAWWTRNTSNGYPAYIMQNAVQNKRYAAGVSLGIRPAMWVDALALEVSFPQTENALDHVQLFMDDIEVLKNTLEEGEVTIHGMSITRQYDGTYRYTLGITGHEDIYGHASDRTGSYQAQGFWANGKRQNYTFEITQEELDAGEGFRVWIINNMVKTRHLDLEMPLPQDYTGQILQAEKTGVSGYMENPEPQYKVSKLSKNDFTLHSISYQEQSDGTYRYTVDYTARAFGRIFPVNHLDENFYMGINALRRTTGQRETLSFTVSRAELDVSQAFELDIYFGYGNELRRGELILPKPEEFP